MNRKPCLNCRRRHPACHDTCAEWQAVKSERDAARKAESHERWLNEEIYLVAQENTHMRKVRKDRRDGRI